MFALLIVLFLLILWVLYKPQSSYSSFYQMLMRKVLKTYNFIPFILSFLLVIETAIICTCLIQHVEGAIKKRPAIATILNNRRDRIDIFKQKSPLYKGFRLDHVITNTNRINALLPLPPSNSSIDTPSLTHIQEYLISKGCTEASVDLMLGVFYNMNQAQVDN